MLQSYRNLIRILPLTALALVIAYSVTPPTTNGASLKSGSKGTFRLPPASTLATDSAPAFPTLYGVQQTRKVNAAFDAFGCFGLGFSRFSPNITQWPATSFEFPSGSAVDYLFGGALWVGGIVNGDTLVSVGADGWQVSGDIYPTPYTSTNRVGTVNEMEPVGDYAFWAEGTDTVHQGITYQSDVISHQAYRPMNIDVVTRSEVWHGTPQDNCILYDVVITNFGQETIHNGYVGLYMDADVGEIVDQNRQQDDVTGSIRDSGVAYIIDNDGNFAQPKPALGAFACRFLWNSWGATDTSYNWWISNANPAQDFGPRLRANYRDFGTAGGLGTPEGDANKYYLMSHAEWDYDQVKTGTTGISDSLWMFPSVPIAQMVSKGFDTKFLLSLGHFTLPPDSSIRFIFATYDADSIHTNPDNGKYITDPTSYNPDTYLAGLNFMHLRSNAQVADSLAGLLLAPEDPVQGLRVTYRTHDTVIVGWDDWCSSNIDGYNIYLDSSATPLAQIGREHRFVFTGMDPTPNYLCTVAHRFGLNVGKWGRPLPFQFASDPPTGVDGPSATVPRKASVAQNFPNPFNPSTTIAFDLPKNGHVSLDIYNVLGQKVATLVDAVLPAGRHQVVWDGSNNRGVAAASGIYFYRFRTGDYVATKKMILLK